MRATVNKAKALNVLVEARLLPKDIHAQELLLFRAYRLAREAELDGEPADPRIKAVAQRIVDTCIEYVED